jgi:hypothetical protein
MNLLGHLVAYSYPSINKAAINSFFFGGGDTCIKLWKPKTTTVLSHLFIFIQRSVSENSTSNFSLMNGTINIEKMLLDVS